MDVRCERCNTEYEFDDALVSGRGTTVKCTNCGHKFKIRRSDGDYAEDFWNVTTADGRTLVFTSLRELQRAIQTNLVERGDQLSRGGKPPKPIGQIPELSPFFDQRDSVRANLPPMREPMQTATGLAPPPPTSAQLGSASMRSSRPPPPPGASPPLAQPPQARSRQSTRPFEKHEAPPPAPAPEPPMTSMKSTLIGPGSLTREPAPAAPAMRTRMASVPPPPPEPEAAPDTERLASGSIPAAPPPAPSPPPPPPAPEPTPQPEPTPVVTVPLPLSSVPAAAKRTPPPPDIVDTSSPLPPPTAPVLRRQLVSDPDEEEAGYRGRYASMSDAPGSMGKRRSVGGFIVAAVVVGGMLMLGAVWAQKNGIDLRNLGGAKPPAPVATTDPRVASFLAAGEKALAEGNLDLAKESLDKASALAEKDPHVLLDVARLAAARADVAWLKTRLLPADAVDEQRLTRDSLAELSASARKAADDALAVAPDDASALRAKIDALRIQGEREAARPLVDKIKPSMSQPESAYVLAALDLAEPEPLWSTVIERLKIAAAVETGPGRARAALVYALARSGDQAGARAELDRLTALPRQHPLVPQLRAFVEQAKPAPAAKADAGAAADGGATVAAEPADPKNPKAGGAGHEALPRDPRVLVSEGEKARAKGDYDRAQKMYSAALEQNPNDSEALAGLAAIAYARRDLANARQSYKRVISINPNYMPALVGLGDVEWDSGDRAAAMKIYKEIVDRYPEGSYPARVKQRIDEQGGP